MKLTLYTITAQPDGENMTQLEPQRTLEDAKRICQEYQNDWNEIPFGGETRDHIEWMGPPHSTWFESKNSIDTQIFYTIAAWELEMEVQIK